MPFSLRFTLKEIDHWASRYAYEDDIPIIRIGEEVQKRGFYTQREFLTLARWKSACNIHRCEANAPKEVEYATRIALSHENRFERLRIGVLTCLHGVGWPMLPCSCTSAKRTRTRYWTLGHCGRSGWTRVRPCTILSSGGSTSNVAATFARKPERRCAPSTAPSGNTRRSIKHE